MASTLTVKRGVAWPIPIKLFPQSSSPTEWIESPTLASGDFKITRYTAAGVYVDGPTNLANLPTVNPAASGCVLIILSSTETNQGILIVEWKDASGAEWASGAITVMTTADDFDDLMTVTDSAASVTAGVSLADGAITAAKIASDAITAAKLADDVTTEIQSGLLTTTAFDAKIGTPAGAGLTALASATNLAILAGYVDTEVAAIKAKTDNLPASPAATGDIPSASSIASAVLSAIMEGSTTVVQGLRIMLSVLAGKSTGGGTTGVAFRDLADSKNRVSATVDADGNRTATTLDGS